MTTPGEAALVDRAGVEGAVLGLDDDPLGRRSRRSGPWSSAVTDGRSRAVVAAAAGDVSTAAPSAAHANARSEAVARHARTTGAAGSRSSNSVAAAAALSSSEPPIRTASSRAIASPRPGAADLVAGVEALEDALARARVDPRAVVGDDQARRAVRRRLLLQSLP